MSQGFVHTEALVSEDAVLGHQTIRVKTYHLSAKREGDEFFTEGGLVNENSNEGGFLFIMNLKI